MKNILVIVLLFNCSIVVGQNNLNIVPIPVQVKMFKDSFTVNSKTIIYYNSTDFYKEVSLLSSVIKTFYGLTLKEKFKPKVYNPKTGEIEKADNSITIYQAPKRALADYDSAHYALSSTKKGIAIYCQKPVSAFYAIQTLIQIFQDNLDSGKRTIPDFAMNDYPRFPYRGMHLDVCRHYFPISFVKKYIDYLAAYKFNTFHWHLTDDQGWRIEIKKYPDLTKIGGWRNGTIIGRYPGKGSDNKPYGGFYTQAEIKEVVQYAKERYIDVIPEIEMPGHSSAAIAAYPWLSCFPAKPTEIPAKMISQKSMDEQKAGRIKLVQETWGVFDDVFCAGKDSTFKFLENVIDEVITLFPSKYFHLGGDESPKTHWKICPACQKRIKDNNLKDEHELQSWFVQRIEKYLNSKGKTMIGWDEILEGGLAPNAVVMSWRGEAGGIEAAKQKHQVIMTPGNPVYFDHTQSKNEDSVTIGGYNPIENVYAYEPIPKELNAEQGKYILGAQANMWAEYLEYPSKVEYMLFPRITALSEVLWSPKEKRDWKDFERRLPTVFERLDKQKINYSKAYYDLQATIESTNNNDGLIQVKLESKFPDSRIMYKFENGDFYGYTKPIVVDKNTDLSFSTFKNNQPLKLGSQKFFFNKSTGKKITLVTQPSKSYPGDGAFTLVNGVQNEKGMSKSSEFLGFNGTDLDATIDLGTLTDISKVTLHVLDQNGSWIYLPSQVEVTYIPDVDYTGEQLKNFPKEIKMIDAEKDKGVKTISIESKQNCRYVKVVAKNYGVIPSGQAGAGNPAWLFVDEIEVQ
jgi:hexosaminidase